MVQWSNGPMVRWFGGSTVWWSAGLVVQWSGGSVDGLLLLCTGPWTLLNFNDLIDFWPNWPQQHLFEQTSGHEVLFCSVLFWTVRRDSNSLNVWQLIWTFGTTEKVTRSYKYPLLPCSKGQWDNKEPWGQMLVEGGFHLENSQQNIDTEWKKNCRNQTEDRGPGGPGHSCHCESSTTSCSFFLSGFCCISGSMTQTSAWRKFYGLPRRYRFCQR